MKRAGSAILYIGGSNSRKGLKSISVSMVVCDEFDEMPAHTIPLAQERMAGQKDKQLWLISTPRFPGQGVNAEFLQSTQEHFLFPCRSCGKQIELLHENLVVTADDIHDPKINDCYVKCVECDTKLFDSSLNADEYAEMKAEMLAPGIWTPYGHKDFEDRGFYINQLYSATITPAILGIAWLKSLTNKAHEQEYHNSKMGDAHEVDGARVTKEVIDECISKQGRQKGWQPASRNRLITMGVDVGRWLHFEIAMWEVQNFGNDINISSKAIILNEGKVNTFHDLDNLMREFQILMAVVDIQPETREALSFAKRFQGHVRLCRYGKGLTDKSIDGSVLEQDNYVITVDRTAWLDLAMARFRNRSIDLPINTSLEYQSHIKNIARVYEEDKDGNPIGRYTHNGPDHFAHARNYNEIALPLAAAMTTNSDIKAFL